MDNVGGGYTLFTEYTRNLAPSFSGMCEKWIITYLKSQWLLRVDASNL